MTLLGAIASLIVGAISGLGCWKLNISIGMTLFVSSIFGAVASVIVDEIIFRRKLR